MTTTTQNLGMPLLVAGQLQPEVTINGDLNTIDAAIGTAATAFGYNVNGSSGLTFAYFGGTVLENGLPVTVAAGSVTLTGSATNYVQRTPAGVVSVNTTGYTAGYLPMATVVTSATNITTVTDTRPAFLTKGGRLVIGIGAPTAVSVTTATTGGSLAAGTYGYRVSALYPWGESVACAEIQVTTTGTTSENTITWTLPAGATAAKVYGRTVGGELLIAQVAAATSTYTDTGSVTPSGALPTGTFTLTEAETNAAILSLEGAITGATTVDFPLRPQVWVVSNETTGAFVTTCTTASGTGVAPSQGTAEVLYCNGTNIVAASSAGGGSGGGSGSVVVDTTGGTVDLTPAQALNAIIQIEGALTANAEIVFPASLEQVWQISNQTTGSYTVTAIVSGSTATALTLAQGASQTIWSDGVNLHMTTGEQGPTGPTGATGATGSTGATGATGPAPTVQVGTVTTLAAGASATVTATESDGVVTFDYGIPQGETGALGTAGSTIAQPILTGETETQVSNTVSGSAATLNQADGTVQALTLTEDCTLTLSPSAGASGTAAGMMLFLTQGTGGSFTVTWPTGTVFAAGSAPTLSTTAGETDILVAVLLAGASAWLITVVAQGVTL